MELLSSYVNGNYPVRIYSDGTKVRGVPDEGCKPLFPENIDIKISDKCDAGCAFCHENSMPDGAICHFEHEFLYSLKPGTELAIGGGNIFENERLRPFLHWCKARGIIANITVNQEHAVYKLRKHAMFEGELSTLMRKGLVHGVGISVSDDIADLHDAIEDEASYEYMPFNRNNIVLHVINGVHEVDELLKLKGRGYKLLILGYKELRRGESYLVAHNEEVEKKKLEMCERLGEVIQAFDVVSFDNLAIDQLDVKKHVNNWDEFYMGDEGNFTMYIDLVKEEFAMNSTSLKRYKLLPTIEEMFAVVRSEAHEMES